MQNLTAVRTARKTGKSHIAVPGRRSSAGIPTGCGRHLATETETVPWRSTDPADRCTRCAEIAGAK